MNPKKFPVDILLSLFIGVLLVWLSPEDKVLGPILKLVYLHGALIFTGLLLFSAAGMVSLVSLLRKNPDILLLFAVEKTAIIFWVSATIVGDITSQIAWGGIFWGEPRFNATIIISLIAISIYFISTAIENSKIISFLGLGLALSVWVLMIEAGKIMHPDNPFGASQLPIRFFFGLITIAFLAASVMTVRWIIKKRHNQILQIKAVS